MSSGSRYVVLLSCLCSSAQEDDQSVTVEAMADAIAWAEIDPQLSNPITDALRIATALFKPIERNRHFGGGYRIEPVEASTKRRCAVASNVFLDCDHK